MDGSGEAGREGTLYRGGIEEHATFLHEPGTMGREEQHRLLSLYISTLGSLWGVWRARSRAGYTTHRTRRKKHTSEVESLAVLAVPKHVLLTWPMICACQPTN